MLNRQRHLSLSYHVRPFTSLRNRWQSIFQSPQLYPWRSQMVTASPQSTTSTSHRRASIWAPSRVAMSATVQRRAWIKVPLMATISKLRGMCRCWISGNRLFLYNQPLTHCRCRRPCRAVEGGPSAPTPTATGEFQDFSAIASVSDEDSS